MLKMQLELTGEFEVLVAEDGEKDAAIAAAKRRTLFRWTCRCRSSTAWRLHGA